MEDVLATKHDFNHGITGKGDPFGTLKSVTLTQGFQICDLRRVGKSTKLKWYMPRRWIRELNTGISKYG